LNKTTPFAGSPTDSDGDPDAWKTENATRAALVI
jgi:hypothetical protein